MLFFCYNFSGDIMIIGSHVNYQGEQLLGCAKQAASYGANTFMFYTGAPQNTIRKSIDKKLLADAKKYMIDNNIDINNVVCHAAYIVNLANKENPEAWNFAIRFLKEELSRITEIGINYLVLHPGNSLKQDRQTALLNIAEGLNYIIDSNTKPMILLETMAGKGTECGINMCELKIILDNVKYSDKVGICLDTCHLNDSGVSIKDFDKYLDEFDKVIGLDKIHCVHINDSKNELGSHKDRHANIGYGTIGFDNLINVLYCPRLNNIPKILETPWIGDYPPYKYEIDKKFNPNLESDVINNS